MAKKIKSEKPVKEPKKTKTPKAPKKEKPVNEPKAGLLDKFKKQKSADDDGLDILTEAKEPFSLQNFFETHIVERARRAKNILRDKGILFFLFSPFQARARLIAQLLILCIGVMFGVIPRASSLVNELQNQAYASEIAGLSSKTVGSITITPAASSNYKKLHMIAFVVEGKNLPSDANKYEVHLARSYGASDWEDVTYSWTMYPVTDTKRILLVSIDQSKQASGYGAFDLYIQLAGDDVSEYAKTPFEITLSTAQETTGLYDKTGIHLSELTEAICGTGKIAEKQAEFEEAIAKYQVALEQAEAMPVDIKVSPTKEELETYCLANRVYRTLDDYSTTEDILSMDPVSSVENVEYDVVLTSSGIEYDSAFVSQLTNDGGYSDEDAIIFDAFENVDEAKKAVTAAMDNVNTAAVSWYSTLASYKLILNQTIQPNTFPLSARCTNTIEDAINFIEHEVEDPGNTDPGGLSGTMTGDDPYNKQEPSNSGEEPVIDPVEEPEEKPEEEPAGNSEEKPTEKPKEESGEKTPSETKPYGNHPVTPITSPDPADSK